jgi:hypothetical protein
MQTGVMEITSVYVTITVGCWSYVVLFVEYSKRSGNAVGSTETKRKFYWFKDDLS